MGWFEFGQLVSWLLARVWLLSWLYRLGVYITFKAVLLRGATQVLPGGGCCMEAGVQGGKEKCCTVCSPALQELCKTTTVGELMERHNLR